MHEILNKLLSGQTCVVSTYYKTGRIELEPGVKVDGVSEYYGINTNQGVYCRNTYADDNYVQVDAEIRTITYNFGSDEGSNVIKRTFTVVNTAASTRKYSPYATHEELLVWRDAEEKFNEALMALHEKLRAEGKDFQVYLSIPYTYLDADQCQELKDRRRAWEGYHWGSYGRKGDEKEKVQHLGRLDTDHLENILITQPQIEPGLRAAIVIEMALPQQSCSAWTER